jgi:hypothetical protein
MTSNLAKLIPVSKKPRRIAPNSINHPLLLEVLDQVTIEIKSIIPEKRSGFRSCAYLLVDIYSQMTQLSYKKCTPDLNIQYMPYIHKFHYFRKRNLGPNKTRRAIPDQPAMSRFQQYLASSGKAEEYGNLILKAQLMYAQKTGMIKDELTFIADYVETPCKKDSKDGYCFGTKEGKTKHKTLTFSIISGDLHVIVATYQIKKSQHKLPLFQKTIKALIDLGLSIKYGLLDRGFYWKEILDWLKTQRITVIIPGRKCADSKRKISLWLQDISGRTGKFLLKLKYVKKQGWKHLTMGFIIVGKRGHHLDEVKRGLKTGKINIDTASQRVFPLLVVRAHKKSVRIVDGNANYIRELYRQRWAIEIAFREVNLLGISNWIQNRGVRLFRFTMKCVVYNMWQISRVMIKQENPDAADLTLDEFCGRLWINRTPQSLIQNKTEIFA